RVRRRLAPPWSARDRDPTRAGHGESAQVRPRPLRLGSPGRPAPDGLAGTAVPGADHAGVRGRGPTQARGPPHDRCRAEARGRLSAGAASAPWLASTLTPALTRNRGHRDTCDWTSRSTLRPGTWPGRRPWSWPRG